MTPTLPPELIEPDVSTRVMAPLWDYLAESWGDQIADSVFERAGLPPAYVRDPSGWVSWEYALHLVDELNRQLFGLEELPDPGHPLWEIYRQAGRRSLTREAMGALWPVVRLLGSPAMVFRVLERESRKVNRVAIMRTVELGRGFARVESWSPDGRDNPGLCASRVGYFEGVPTVWGLPLARVVHEQCIHDPVAPAPRCVYRVEFEEHRAPWKLAVVGGVLGTLIAGMLGFLAGGLVEVVLGASLGMALGLAWSGWSSLRGLRRLHHAESERLGELLAEQDQRYSELVEGERRFTQVADVIPHVFWLYSPERSEYTYLSRAYEDLTGRARSAARAGGLWDDLILDEESPSGEEVAPHERVFSIRGLAGKRVIRERAFRVRDGQGRVTHLAGFAEDITERLQVRASLKRQEEELRVARRLEAVGRLAGGVAHDFNNLLTVIENSARYALETAGDGHEAAEDLRQVLRATSRASALTSQLLAYSRKQVLELVPLDLRQVVGQTGEMLARLLPEDVRFHLEMDPELPSVVGDEGQLGQVLMNLAVNAVDAMSGGGELVIRAMREELTEPLEHHHGTLEPGVFALLVVEDSGAGMSQEVVERAFEPFFSTKELGKGTGLGLSTVAGIVGQHDGAVSCWSREGRGTRMEIRLPATRREVHSPSSEHMEPVEVDHPGASVLLVEDEHILRGLCARILRDAGYQVLESTSAEQAVRLGLDEQLQVDLLLTDVVMPGMSGTEVAEAIRAVRPDLRVLYTSGYADDMVAERGLEPGAAFLPKPYGPVALREAVERTLRAGG